MLHCIFCFYMVVHAHSGYLSTICLFAGETLEVGVWVEVEAEVEVDAEAEEEVDYEHNEKGKYKDNDSKKVLGGVK